MNISCKVKIRNKLFGRKFDRLFRKTVTVILRSFTLWWQQHIFHYLDVVMKWDLHPMSIKKYQQAMLFTLQWQRHEKYWKQEYIPVGCVPPAHWPTVSRSAGGSVRGMHAHRHARSPLRLRAVTRKHSSRMHTARLLTVVYVGGWWEPDPPSWTEGLIDRCKNITLLQLHLRAVKRLLLQCERPLTCTTGRSEVNVRSQKANPQAKLIDLVRHSSVLLSL